MNAKSVFVKTIKGILLVLEAVIVIVLGFVSVLLSNSIRWMFETWSYLTMDEVAYLLNSPMEGTSEEIIMEYVGYCVPASILALLLIFILMIVLRKRRWMYHTAMAGILVCSVALAGYYLNMAWVRLDIANYSKNKSTYSTFIEDNYVNADDVAIRFPEQKRNLIYIFLESMETTYADVENGGAFDISYIPELTEIAQQNEDFSGSGTALNGGYSMPQTTWTVAAMFAQSAGLPLSIPLENNQMNTQDAFFEGTNALGDILQQAGYSQTLLIGSDATFGGRRLLFSGHGDFTIHDYNYAAREGLIPEGYRVWWGYEDKRLFQFAKRELRSLSQQDEPFNLTLLTVDTHKEDGYVCGDCGNKFGDDQYGNVIACSSQKVAEFIRWVQRQDFYENTTIVIAGDHLTMDSDFCRDVPLDYTRKVYTAYINSAVEPEKPELYRDYTTFDHFPTTLASLGAEIEGNRLGLGTNLFSSEWTLTEKYQRDRMALELNRKSKFMEELTSYINLDLPEAEIILQDYDPVTGIQPIVITDIKNVRGNIRALNVAVWTLDGQTDLQWMQAVQNPDGDYTMDINISSFGSRMENYNIHVYTVLENGSTKFLTSTITEIKQIDAEQREMGQMGTEQTEAGQMENNQMEPGQVENDQMEPGQIDNNQMETGQMENNQMEPGQIDNNQMETGQIGTDQMQPGQFETQ